MILIGEASSQESLMFEAWCRYYSLASAFDKGNALQSPTLPVRVPSQE